MEDYFYRQMRKMQRQMDDLFRDFGEPGLLMGPKDVVQSEFRSPLSDIWEEKDKIHAKIEIPGVDKKDIQINATEHDIEVKVEKKEEKKTEKKGMYRYERSYSGFYRKFTLPHTIDPDKIQAEYKDGILELSAPTKTIGSSRKQISVK
ncbi:Hsp20/alpha crystallin family protein [Candidatus Woesearchaeota archaeon]|nr:Hsp20/alpha crystallin family protein [Candidatus Woesearchaeota archaeon]